MSKSRIIFSICVLISLCLLSVSGCGDRNNEIVFDPDTGSHVENWVHNHGNVFLAGKGACAECHGSDLGGGISRVGCFSPAFGGTPCHGSLGFHGTGWDDPDVHGPDTKAAPGALTGFASCQLCHGRDFAGGAIRVSCFTSRCHGVPAPHSPGPWVAPAARTHADTDVRNAPVCAECHRDESGAGVPLSTPPGCFNNALCHTERNPHPTGWSDPDLHGAAAKSAPGPGAGFATCQSCHGDDFAGGITSTSCFLCHASAPHSPEPWLIPQSARTHTDTDRQNAPVCAECHRDESGAGLPPSIPPGCFNNTLCHAVVGAPHAVPFTDPAEHGPDAKADLTFCQECHAEPSDGEPGSDPRFDVAIGGLPTGCEAAACHDPFTAHPVPWQGPDATSHQSAGNLASACGLCHGATLNGGVGPACSVCHTAGSPLVLKDCTSCHDIPPSGSVRPNRKGAHLEHDALAGVTGICDTCHIGAGSGTLNHYDANPPADVVIPGTYDARTGTASFSAGRCSFVSCHGGPRTQSGSQVRQNPPQSAPSQTTAWSGSIDVDTECMLCHVLGPSSGSPEFNSYFSGEHEEHVFGEGVSCTVCHDTVKLRVNHFTTLSTPQMEGPASATIADNVLYNPATGTCNPSSGGISGCHGQESWR